MFWVLGIGMALSLGLSVKLYTDARRVGPLYAKTQAMVTQLEQELTDARHTVETQATDLVGLQGELDHLQDRLTETEHEIARLRYEQDTLVHANTSLSQRLALTLDEQHALEARLSSLKELRAAIRDVKRKLWQARWQSWQDVWLVWKLKADAQRMADREALMNGNQGFLVRNGVPTTGTVTRLQVRVLDPQTQ